MKVKWSGKINIKLPLKELNCYDEKSIAAGLIQNNSAQDILQIAKGKKGAPLSKIKPFAAI